MDEKRAPGESVGADLRAATNLIRATAVPGDGGHTRGGHLEAYIFMKDLMTPSGGGHRENPCQTRDPNQNSRALSSATLLTSWPRQIHSERNSR